MSTPINEKEQYSFPAFAPSHPTSHQTHERRSSDEDGTLQGEIPDDASVNHLRVTTSYAKGDDQSQGRDNTPMSPAAQRAASRRLDDDLEMLQAERMVSNAEREDLNRSKSIGRSRSRVATEPLDDFDINTNPIHENTKVYQPPANPTTKFAKVFKKIHNSSFLVRWLCYILPLFLILLIPVLLGRLVFPEVGVGGSNGVALFWFGIWLEIVWLTLWLSRVRSSTLIVRILLTNAAYREMYTLPYGCYCKCLYQQCEKMERSRESARDPSDPVLLGLSG